MLRYGNSVSGSGSGGNSDVNKLKPTYGWENEKIFIKTMKCFMTFAPFCI
jgi:hypothetical protein